MYDSKRKLYYTIENSPITITVLVSIKHQIAKLFRLKNYIELNYKLFSINYFSITSWDLLQVIDFLNGIPIYQPGAAPVAQRRNVELGAAHPTPDTHHVHHTYVVEEHDGVTP